MEPNEIIEKAVHYFESGYNCAESVILTIAEEVLNIKSNLIPKIATCFGGGISRQGYVCGAVSGAIMGFGLKYGRNDPKELKAKAYRQATKFYKEFLNRFGTIICKELSGCDLSTVEGVRKFRQERVLEQKCYYIVSSTIEFFMDVIHSDT